MSKIAIKVENLSKAYQLGNIGTGTISRDIERWWARIRGKEDPFLRIGEANDRTTKSESNIVWSLKDINFEIEQGDAVGIIGRNGAGKSTLLKILSRVTAPTTGKIIGKGRIASLLEVGTGFHPELTGRENIYLNGAILGMRKREIDRKFDEIVEFSGVERYIDTPVKRYSSGMYVRLAFAVAAHLESEILIVDEVLAVGDAEFQKKCLGKMGEVSKGEGRTVLFVSHNMGMVSQLCRNAILLNKGTIDYIGPVSSVINKYLKIQSTTNEFLYIPELNVAKSNFIESIKIKNNDNQYVSSFSFDQHIIIEFVCQINDFYDDLLIGIGMMDKSNSRVFTVVKEITFFLDKQKNIICGELKLPNSLFAPNIYSFVLALWTKTGVIHDLAENVCVISIHDNGTSLSAFEGADYGSVIINPIWKSC